MMVPRNYSDCTQNEWLPLGPFFSLNFGNIVTCFCNENAFFSENATYAKSAEDPLSLLKTSNFKCASYILHWEHVKEHGHVCKARINPDFHNDRKKQTAFVTFGVRQRHLFLTAHSTYLILFSVINWSGLILSFLIAEPFYRQQVIMKNGRSQEVKLTKERMVFYIYFKTIIIDTSNHHRIPSCIKFEKR